MINAVRAAMEAADNRFQLWTHLISEQHLRTVAEVGVYRGAFAKALLDGCPDITVYRLSTLGGPRRLEQARQPPR